MDIGVIGHRGYWRHWSSWILASLVIVDIWRHGAVVAVPVAREAVVHIVCG